MAAASTGAGGAGAAAGAVVAVAGSADASSAFVLSSEVSAPPVGAAGVDARAPVVGALDDEAAGVEAAEAAAASAFTLVSVLAGGVDGLAAVSVGRAAGGVSVVTGEGDGSGRGAGSAESSVARSTIRAKRSSSVRGARDGAAAGRAGGAGAARAAAADMRGPEAPGCGRRGSRILRRMARRPA